MQFNSSHLIVRRYAVQLVEPNRQNSALVVPRSALKGIVENTSETTQRYGYQLQHAWCSGESVRDLSYTSRGSGGPSSPVPHTGLESTWQICVANWYNQILALSGTHTGFQDAETAGTGPNGDAQNQNDYCSAFFLCTCQYHSGSEADPGVAMLVRNAGGHVFVGNRSAIGGSRARY
jgi:hypothetical protein